MIFFHLETNIVAYSFDSAYMNGVLGMNYFINMMTGLPIPGPDADQATKDAFTLPAWEKSLITSILSAGTFFGAIIAGDLADYFGRRITIVSGCVVFIVGCCLQTASSGLGLVSYFVGNLCLEVLIDFAAGGRPSCLWLWGRFYFSYHHSLHVGDRS